MDIMELPWVESFQKLDLPKELTNIYSSYRTKDIFIPQQKRTPRIVIVVIVVDVVVVIVVIVRVIVGQQREFLVHKIYI